MLMTAFATKDTLLFLFEARSKLSKLLIVRTITNLHLYLWYYNNAMRQAHSPIKGGGSERRQEVIYKSGEMLNFAKEFDMLPLRARDSERPAWMRENTLWTKKTNRKNQKMPARARTMKQ
jgi:hypothetical protein